MGFDEQAGAVVSAEEEDGTNNGVFVEALEVVDLAEGDEGGGADAAEAEMKLESIL